MILDEGVGYLGPKLGEQRQMLGEGLSNVMGRVAGDVITEE